MITNDQSAIVDVLAIYLRIIKVISDLQSLHLQ